MISHPLTRAALALVGLFAVVAGIALLTEGGADEAEEIAFAAIVLAVGLIHLGAAAMGGRAARLGLIAVAADALVVGYLVYVFSQNNVG